MNNYSDYTIHRRIIKPLGYSFNGLKLAFESEAAFKVELIILCIFIPVAFTFDISALSKALMVSSWLAIIILELVNTAIETTINRISNERHNLSKKAKDIGSALVLMSFINAVSVWSIILFL